jgi:hypothetical protein
MTQRIRDFRKRTEGWHLPTRSCALHAQTLNTCVDQLAPRPATRSHTHTHNLHARARTHSRAPFSHKANTHTHTCTNTCKQRHAGTRCEEKPAGNPNTIITAHPALHARWAHQTDLDDRQLFSTNNNADRGCQQRPHTTTHSLHDADRGCILPHTRPACSTPSLLPRPRTGNVTRTTTE